MKKTYFKPTNELFMLLCCIYLVGCSASKHLGVATIKKPEMTSKDTEAWRSYYNDQMDAYAGVVNPPDDKYPEEAQTGFKQASIDWRKQVGKTTLNNTLLGIGLGIFIPLMLSLMISSASGV